MAVLGFTLPPDSGEKLSLGELGKPLLKVPFPFVETIIVAGQTTISNKKEWRVFSRSVFKKF